jgi:hypothetical protein
MLLVLALFLMGSVYAVLAPSPKVAADTGTTQQIEEGRRCSRSAAPPATG